MPSNPFHCVSFLLKLQPIRWYCCGLRITGITLCKYIAQWVYTGRVAPAYICVGAWRIIDLWCTTMRARANMLLRNRPCGFAARSSLRMRVTKCANPWISHFSRRFLHKAPDKAVYGGWFTFIIPLIVKWYGNYWLLQMMVIVVPRLYVCIAM